MLMDIEFTLREVRNILLQREKIEKKLINKYNPSYFQLADYFEVPVKCIKKDLGKNGNGIKNVEPKKWSSLKRARNRKLLTLLDKGEDEKKVLISFGLWRMPTDLKEKSILPDNIPYENEVFETGAPIDTDEDAVKLGVSLVLYGADVEDVSRLTGLSKSCLARITGNKSLEDSIKQYNSRSQYYRKKKNKTKQEEMQKRRLEVYKQYLQGVRQKDIAKELEVSRVTVVNDWRAIKHEKNIERQRNTGKGSSLN